MGQGQSSAINKSAIGQEVQKAIDQHVMDYHSVEQFGLPGNLSLRDWILIAILIIVIFKIMKKK